MRAEVLRSDREHGREADRRIHRVAAADPVPEAEHVGGVDAELRHALGVGRHGDEVPAHRPLVAERAQAPGARRMGVGQRLERREGLRADDEQRLLGIEVARGFLEVGAVDVGDEAEGHVAPAVMTQRLVGHHRAEVGAADADIDDVADALAGVARASAPLRTCSRESRHALEHRVHLGHDVDAVDQDPLARRRPQGDVQDGALLGHIDFLAAEHRFDARRAGRIPRQGAVAARIVSSVDAVLRVVEIEARGFCCQALAAPGIVWRRAGDRCTARIVRGVRLELFPPGSPLMDAQRSPAGRSSRRRA